MTLDQVRRRGPRFAASLETNGPPNPEQAPNKALLYAIRGDRRDARAAVTHMLKGYDSGPWTTTQGDQIEAIAIAYDWLRGLDGGLSDEERTSIEEILIESGRAAIRNLAQGASIYHTRMYAWANAALFAGLALHGDHPEAEELIDFGLLYYKQRLLPARRHLGGAWFNALSYGKKYMCRSVFSMLAAWRSASGEDLWADARAEEMLEFLFYTLRPDHRFASYGDMFNSMWDSNQGTMRVVAQAVHETRNPYGQSFLEEIRRRWGGPCYESHSAWRQVYEDAAIPARPRSDLPTARLFGRDSLGLAVMRSGWGADDTWLLFKCGDYGDNHGHFDQGHFELFHKGELALDHYYGAKATVYHNTILVNDPDDAGDIGNQREFSRQVHASLESYLSDPLVRTGDILDYGRRNKTSWVLGDVTPAYDPAKVKSFRRRVVFVEGRYVVVFDVVSVAHARLRRRFLLHYPTEPTLSGQSFLWRNGGGRLRGYTLAPAAAKLSTIAAGAAGRTEGERRWRKYWPAGRLEVEPATYDSTETSFLHLLAPGDAGAPAPTFDFVENVGDYTLTLAGQELVFGKDGIAFEMHTDSKTAA